MKAQGERGGLGMVSTSRFITDAPAPANRRRQEHAQRPAGLQRHGHLMLVASYVNVDALDAGGITPAAWAANPRDTAQPPLDFNARKYMRQTQRPA